MNKTLKDNREMKYSGIDWIGKIPKEWEVRKLSSKYKFHTGFTPDTKKAEFYDDEGFNWVTISDLNKSKVILDTQKKISELGVAATKGTLTPKGSLLYSFKLSVGQVGMAGKDLYTNEAIASFPPNQNECLNFLYYSSQVCIIQNANENIYGAKLLNQELIKSAKIVLPPLHEQQAIANYLDKQVGKIDELISDQNQAIENWKAYKQSLITETVTKGLNPNVEMKDSGIEWIGEIPIGWETRRIKYTLYPKNGIKIGPFGSSLKLEMMNEAYPFKVYGQENIIRDSFTIGSRFINKEKFIELQNYLLEPGDIILSTMGTIGRCKVVPNNIQTGIMDSHLIRLRLKSCINRRFFEYVWDMSTIIRNQLNLESKGSIMDGLNSKIIKNTLFIIPPLHEQQVIVDFLDEKCSKIDQMIKQKQALIKQLEEYKQSLIYECVTGKRCVL